MKRKSLADSYLCAFCMEMTMLLGAGVVPYDGVMILRDDEPDRAGKLIMQSLLEPLENGAPLSEALRVSGYFPDYMADMTEAGEKTGRLTETMKALSQHYDRQDRLAVAIRNAVMYPAILLIMMVAVVLILIIRVLPIFNDVFARLGNRMSPLAVSLMRFGGWLGNASAVIAAIGGLIFAAALAVWGIPPVRVKTLNTFRDIFGGRGILGKIAASRFISVMALSVASGLDVLDAVEMAAAVSGGARAVDKRHRKCADLLRSGHPLTESFLLTGILSARNVRMLSIGVRSGKTDAAMVEIAGRSERAVQDEINRLVGMIEPALVIVTSVIVGIILLSVMLPLMSIMTAIG